MEITYVGPWILLGIGTLLMLAAVYIAVAQQRKPLILLTFGLLSVGVGIHGPLFMGQYAEFFRAMSRMVGTANSETYGPVLERIGQGDFTPELQDIALSYALDHPIPDMDQLLSEAIAGATNEEGRNALENFDSAYEERALEQMLTSTILPLTSKPMDPEAYQNLFRRIGQGEFDRELQDIALGYALSQPIPDMDRLLSEALGGATNEEGRNALENLNSSYEKRVREQRLATAILSNIEQVSDFERLLQSDEFSAQDLEQLIRRPDITPPDF